MYSQKQSHVQAMTLCVLYEMTYLSYISVFLQVLRLKAYGGGGIHDGKRGTAGSLLFLLSGSVKLKNEHALCCSVSLCAVCLYKNFCQNMEKR